VLTPGARRHVGCHRSPVPLRQEADTDWAVQIDSRRRLRNNTDWCWGWGWCSRPGACRQRLLLQYPHLVPPTALLRRDQAGLTGEVRRSVSSLVSSPVGVRGLPLPGRGDRVAVRWYLRYGLSYRDVEELLAERGIDVDHVTVYRWVQRFTPLLADAARFARHSPGDRWFVDETYVKVNGVWRYVYRAIDQHGQVIDVLLTSCRIFAAVTTSSESTSTPHYGSPRRSPNSPMRSDACSGLVQHVR